MSMFSYPSSFPSDALSQYHPQPRLQILFQGTVHPHSGPRRRFYSWLQPTISSRDVAASEVSFSGTKASHNNRFEKAWATNALIKLNQNLGYTGALTIVQLRNAKNAQAFQLKQPQISRRVIYIGLCAGTHFTHRFSPLPRWMLVYLWPGSITLHWLVASCLSMTEPSLSPSGSGNPLALY
jgi:hypothetical protein